MSNKMKEALLKIKNTAISLADAQVIALEALRLESDEPAILKDPVEHRAEIEEAFGQVVDQTAYMKFDEETKKQWWVLFVHGYMRGEKVSQTKRTFGGGLKTQCAVCSNEFVMLAPPELPFMDREVKLHLATNYFSDEDAITSALLMIDDFEAKIHSNK